jgi:hypothetical protein
MNHDHMSESASTSLVISAIWWALVLYAVLSVLAR